LAPKTGWPFNEQKTPPTVAGHRLLSHPVHSLDTIPTELSRLPRLFHIK
jgi:hypothetical protein